MILKVPQDSTNICLLRNVLTPLPWVFQRARAKKWPTWVGHDSPKFQKSLHFGFIMFYQHFFAQYLWIIIRHRKWTCWVPQLGSSSTIGRPENYKIWQVQTEIAVGQSLMLLCEAAFLLSSRVESAEISAANSWPPGPWKFPCRNWRSLSWRLLGSKLMTFSRGNHGGFWVASRGKNLMVTDGFLQINQVVIMISGSESPRNWT